MNIRRERGPLRVLIGSVALAAVTSACGGQDDGTTETATADLLSNVPYLNGQAVALGGTAGDATLFNNKAYFAYIRPDTSIGILVETNLSNNGQSVTSYALPWKAQFGPALLAANNMLYLFHLENSTLGMATSTDGVNWINGTWLTGQRAFTTPPAAVNLNNQPLVYIGVDVGNGFSEIQQYNISGTTASGPYHVGNGVYSRARPSATMWNGTLYLAIQDQLNGGQAAITHWNGAWSGETLTGKVGIPSIYPLGVSALEMVYRGTDSHIYHAYTSDGVSFGSSTRDNASTTNHAPIPFENFGFANWVFYVGVDNELFTVLE